MRDCADTAKIELTALLSHYLMEAQRIYGKTRADHKPQVKAEIARLCDRIKEEAVKPQR